MAALLDELTNVIFHASELGRSDVLKNAVQELKLKMPHFSKEEIAEILSTPRAEDGLTPLHVASMMAHADVIRFLLTMGANLLVVPSHGEHKGKTAYDIGSDAVKQIFHVYFFEQVAIGNTKLIDTLLQSGIPVDIVDGPKTRETPLHWACSFNNVDIVKVLLRHGSDVSRRNFQDQSCLHMACKRCDLALVSLLLLEGADSSQQDHLLKLPCDYLPNVNDNNEETIQKIKELLQNPPVPTMDYRNQYLDSLSPPSQQQQQPGSHKSDITLSSSIASQQQQQQGQQQQQVNRDIDTKDWSSDDDDRLTSAQAEENYAGNSNPQLVLWPAPRLQTRHPGIPLVLSSSTPLNIYVSPHFPLALHLNIKDDDDNNSYNKSEAVVDSHYVNILEQAGLIAFFQQHNFSVIVTHSLNASRNTDNNNNNSTNQSKIRLSIDPELCASADSFQVTVSSDHLNVLAASLRGLLYALHSVVQILQLHSEIAVSGGNNNSSKNSANNLTTVLVPPIMISDEPDCANRCLSWSFRSHCLLKSFNLTEHLKLVSQLRFNRLLLTVDCLDSSQQEQTVAQNRSEVESTLSSFLIQTEKLLISVVPQFIFTSCLETIPVAVLHLFQAHQQQHRPQQQQQQQQVVSLRFLFSSEEVKKNIEESFSDAFVERLLEFWFNEHLNNDVNSNGNNGIQRSESGASASYQQQQQQQQRRLDMSMETKVQLLCQSACLLALRSLQQHGVNSLLLFTTDWVERVVQPQKIATQLGFHLIHATSTITTSRVHAHAFSTRNMDFAEVSTISLKPLVFFGHYVHALDQFLNHTKATITTSTRWLILPGFNEFDYNYPLLLLKFTLFLCSGCCWNQKATLDILAVGSEAASNSLQQRQQQQQDSRNSSLYCGSIFKEVASLLLFHKRTQQLCEKHFCVLSLLTGEWMFQFLSNDAFGSSNTVNNDVDDNNNNNNNSGSGSNQDSTQLFQQYNQQTLGHTEQYLWSVVSGAPLSLLLESVVPNKQSLGDCLKCYRRLLLKTNWKRVDGQHPPKSFLENLTGFKLTTSSSITSTSNIDDEVTELLSTVQQVSILCRSLLLAYNSMSKHAITPTPTETASLVTTTSVGPVTLQQLMRHLPLGARSDVANQLLESLEYFAHAWREKFDVLHFAPIPQADLSALQSRLLDIQQVLEVSSLRQKQHHRHHQSSLVKHFLKEYMREKRPSMPLASFFLYISENLPMSTLPHVTLTRIFTK